MFVKQFVGACGGASLLQGISKHACPAGVVCNRLRRGESFLENSVCTPARRGHGKVCGRLRRGEFYIRLQFVRLAAVAFLLLV